MILKLLSSYLFKFKSLVCRALRQHNDAQHNILYRVQTQHYEDHYNNKCKETVSVTTLSLMALDTECGYMLCLANKSFL
jgi:hypothetical protein